MPDPTAALRAALNEHGLDPGASIDWSGKFVYIRVDGDKRGEKSGRYKAFSDPPQSAWYKNWRTGLEGTWCVKGGEDLTEEDKAAWAEMQRKREAEQEARAARAARRYQEIWDNADPPDLSHPYLVKKGLPAAPGIRQSKNHLLVPMRSFEKGNPISSLQSISPDGKKRFAPSGRAAGTRMTIGHKTLKEKGGVIYLAEGWATATSIHLATSCPTIVCFFAGNLLSVAQSLRKKLPKQHLVICADNDAWSMTPNGRNPGLRAATWAAQETGSDVVLPQFAEACRNEDCDRSCGAAHPTDFDDLRQLEGLDRVRHFLDPALVPGDALSPSIEKEPLPPPQEPLEPPERWYDTAPFRCLGYDKGPYYYYHPAGTGQIMALTPAGHDRKTLLPLAPFSWWLKTFPGSQGVSWVTAADALFRASERAGVFSPRRARGRGAWPERDADGNLGVLIHLGDRMIVPGSKKTVQPDRYVSPTRHIYERQQAMAGPSMDPMTVEESQEILQLFRDLLWVEPASADLLAGWATLAPVCGALDWRPHVWLTGEMGAGKTEVFRGLLQPLMGDGVLNVKAGTTEAGIRGELKSDAFPILFDEAEESEGVGTNIQRVLALARQSSSDTDAKVIKGTRTGGSVQYLIRSMFCLASIGGAVHQESDRSRVCMLHLKGASLVDHRERKAHWDAYQPRMAKITPEVGRRLIARTLKLLRNGVMFETVKIFRSESSTVLKDQRLGDQYGTLYAGCWSLMSDDLPDPQVVREMVGSEDLSSYQQDRQPEGLKAIRMLLQQRERIDTSDGLKTYAVGQMVEACMGRGSTALSEDDANKTLRQLGLKVDMFDGAYVLQVANQSEWIGKVLKDTIYGRGIRNILRSLPQVSAESPVVRFHAGLQVRCSIVPISIIEIEEESS